MAQTGESVSWREAAAGVWVGQAGEREDYTLLSAAGFPPRRHALREMPAAAFPLDPEEIRALRRRGKVFLRFPLGKDEAIYGLGLDFNGVRRNKTAQTLHVDAWEGRSGRTHAPVPFTVSSRGYGVLINSARYLTFTVGTGVRRDASRPPTVIDRNTNPSEWQAVPDSDGIEVYVPAEGAEIFVFAGPTALDAVRRFNLFCGGGCLPPKWGLGFAHRTPALYTQEQVAREAAEFQERGFPLDCIGLEPGWHDHAYPCSFAWDGGRFPDPAGMVEDLARGGVRVNLWFNPYVAPSAPLAADLLPYAGSHTVWNGIVPDYTLAEARRIFGDHLRRNQIAPGVAGFKIDEVDGHDHWLWPDVATFPSGLDAEQLRQTYGVLVQGLTFALFREADRRTYGLTRGSNAGAAALPYALYSDSYSFQGYLTALCNSGFSGILWCPEVRGAQTAEEWVRRIQMVCFSPLAMLNAWASGAKPWTFAEIAEPVRQALLLRMRLLPYLYTAFAEYYFRGTPPIRPMQLVEGFAPGAGEPVKDQFLLGDALLVAPAPPGQETRTVVLPPGRWFDFHTGAFVGENETISVAPALDCVPLFVRDGGIIPLIPERLHTPRAGEIVSLEARHYGESEGEFLLYDDDGETFGYERGVYSWTRLRARRHTAGDWRGEVVRDAADKPFHYGEITWKF